MMQGPLKKKEKEEKIDFREAVCRRPDNSFSGPRASHSI
jgi:hypothetical protein